MSTNVGTTPRKNLTRTQRLKLFEDHKGICCICKTQIMAGQKWIDEHIKPLGLGGSNDITNRGPAHIKCASAKTTEQDIPRIAKAKRQKMASLGIRDETKPKIKSPGFAKRAKPDRPEKQMPPRQGGIYAQYFEKESAR